MADPFTVASGLDPGTLLFTVDGSGNVTVVGTLTVAGAVVLSTSIRTTAPVNVTRVGVDNAITVREAGDAQARLLVSSDGKIQWGDGTTLDTDLYRQGADQLATDDDFLIRTAGKGLQVKEGANAKMGTATLVAGAATVATTAVTANSRIFVTSQVDGGAPGFLRVSTRTAATSFVITSSSGTDTSTVAWFIVEPSA